MISNLIVPLALFGLGFLAFIWLTGWTHLETEPSPLPRRPEPGVSALGSSEGDDEWVDEHGWDRTPGQEPREVGLP